MTLQTVSNMSPIKFALKLRIVLIISAFAIPGQMRHKLLGILPIVLWREKKDRRSHISARKRACACVRVHVRVCLRMF